MSVLLHRAKCLKRGWGRTARGNIMAKQWTGRAWHRPVPWMRATEVAANFSSKLIQRLCPFSVSWHVLWEHIKLPSKMFCCPARHNSLSKLPGVNYKVKKEILSTGLFPTNFSKGNFSKGARGHVVLRLYIYYFAIMVDHRNVSFISHSTHHFR